MDQPKFADYDWWKKNKPKSIQGNVVDPLLKAQQGPQADRVKLVKIYENSGDMDALQQISDMVDGLGKLSTELKRVSVAALKEKHADFAKGCDRMAAFATDTMKAVGAALADAEKKLKAAGGQGDDVTALNLRTADKVPKDFATGEKV